MEDALIFAMEQKRQRVVIFCGDVPDTDGNHSHTQQRDSAIHVAAQLEYRPPKCGD